MTDICVKATFTEPVLGTAPGDPDIYRKWIATHAPDAKTMDEEVAELGVDAVAEKGITYFRRLKDGTPYLYDYMIKGFMKSAARAKAKVPGSITNGAKAYIKEIDTLIFINERHIPIHTDEEMSFLTRPLRAQTMQGERVSLAVSEMIEPGATIEFTIRCLVDKDVDMVKEWLDYGQYNGLSQWRNGSYGRFKWELISEKVVDEGGSKTTTAKKTATKTATTKKAPAKKTTAKTTAKKAG